MDRVERGLIMWAVVSIWMTASWLTHVVSCIMNAEFVFMVAGAIMAPIAFVHGTGIWLGVW